MKTLSFEEMEGVKGGEPTPFEKLKWESLTSNCSFINSMIDATSGGTWDDTWFWMDAGIQNDCW